MKITELQAQTIFKQIGGQALFMMGAKNKAFSTSNGYVQFKIGRNSKGINHIKIYLEPSDTYRIQFLKVRAGRVQIVSDHSEIYVEDLHRLIEKETGMYLTLASKSS